MKNFHPIVTVIYYAAIIGLSMFSDSPVFLILSLIGAISYAVCSKDGEAGKTIGSIIAVIAIILTFATLINGFFTHNGATVLFYLGPNRVTLEAFIYGLVMGLMIVTVIIWFMSFGVVMSSDKLIDVFGRMAPVIGLTISMIFRFIPLLKRRYRDIKMGQVSLGRGDIKGPINILRQKVKELSILISWSLEASIESADSMAARGYGLPGRTSYRVFKFNNRDMAAIVSVLLLTVLAIICYIKGSYRVYYYPTVRFAGEHNNVIGVIGLIAFVVLALLPTAIDLYGDYKWRKSA